MSEIRIAMGKILFALCILLNCHGVISWKNKWDGPLNFHCRSPSQYIDAVVSFHDNSREDRRYELHCGETGRRGRDIRCQWTGYVNGYDHAVHYQCPGAGYINGMASVHHNGAEDRRHRFRCCGPRRSNYHYKNCRWTGWLNHYDHPVVYFVPRGYVLRGVNSIHNNRFEDRRFQFEVCRLVKK
ncbi:hemagglutinin/amebocyte aggregation factor-like [Ostrea edulis]|uniref:hemagglutinin/amebocyte aggregation factor-like n=1 Tax=Ostrea edulis TaxID=37623 RepID=UPI0024AF01BE|nr:hemagglutinin/amebocyte aggregation factor-like [Ostrea edulis]